MLKGVNLQECIRHVRLTSPKRVRTTFYFTAFTAFYFTQIWAEQSPEQFQSP